MRQRSLGVWFHSRSLIVGIDSLREQVTGKLSVEEGLEGEMTPTLQLLTKNAFLEEINNVFDF